MFSLRLAIRAIRDGPRPNNRQERKTGEGDWADFYPINMHRVAEFFADVISCGAGLYLMILRLM